MRRLETDYEGRVNFQQLNIDDPKNDAAKAKYRFNGQPQVVIVDSAGKIAFSKHTDLTYEALKQDLETLLKKP